MFTGIVESIGRIAGLRVSGDGVDLDIEAPDIAPALVVGQSVATAGVCLTVTQADRRTFSVTAVAETMRRTVLGDRTVGDRVNLERSLRAGDRLDGHLVQGHVDGVGVVTRVVPASPGRELVVTHDAELSRFIAFKGSITIDGVSLTVAALEDESFRVALVPHTLAVTTLGALEVGGRVNLEVDVLARYLERLISKTRCSVGESGDARRGRTEAAERY